MVQSDTKKASKKIFLEAYKKTNCHIAKSCELVNMPRIKYYRWFNNDEKFRQQVESIREQILDLAEEVLIEALEDKDKTTAMFILKTLGRERGYGEKSEAVSQGKSINLIINDPEFKYPRIDQEKRE